MPRRRSQATDGRNNRHIGFVEGKRREQEGLEGCLVDASACLYDEDPNVHRNGYSPSSLVVTLEGGSRKFSMEPPRFTSARRPPIMFTFLGDDHSPIPLRCATPDSLPQRVFTGIVAKCRSAAPEVVDLATSPGPPTISLPAPPTAAAIIPSPSPPRPSAQSMLPTATPNLQGNSSIVPGITQQPAASSEPMDSCTLPSDPPPPSPVQPRRRTSRPFILDSSSSEDDSAGQQKPPSVQLPRCSVSLSRISLADMKKSTHVRSQSSPAAFPTAPPLPPSKPLAGYRIPKVSSGAAGTKGSTRVAHPLAQTYASPLQTPAGTSISEKLRRLREKQEIDNAAIKRREERRAAKSREQATKGSLPRQASGTAEAKTKAKEGQPKASSGAAKAKEATKTPMGEKPNKAKQTSSTGKAGSHLGSKHSERRDHKSKHKSRHHGKSSRHSSSKHSKDGKQKATNLAPVPTTTEEKAALINSSLQQLAELAKRKTGGSTPPAMPMEQQEDLPVILIVPPSVESTAPVNAPFGPSAPFLEPSNLAQVPMDIDPQDSSKPPN